MNRRNVLVLAATSVAGLHAAGASAQQSSGIEAIKAANQAFYAALSARDTKAMVALWANKPYVVNIGPRSKTVAVGYADAVSGYWPAAFDAFSEMAVSPASIDQVQTDGKLAWVIGTESAVLQPRAGGEALKFETFFTNIFEKNGSRWLLVSHHAQVIPK
ncbi:nuclear transport factor 2 family protein [Cupriavidus basilensis]|uniref:Nuclear transport factor 2 family protein n=1 Tax=Cupriavidus basilensis TaxID=68895 RepID=A0A7M2H2B0_9BURK|nr:nuclear transport factor 2 family protein [Cupriavidus basilensis]QOT79216.1 nuclear transport factor 2 family protein [Cupriavidus basilensis]